MSLKRIALGALIASLLLAGAAAATLFLLPATLTAVAAYSVFGLTIAGLVGANALAQIGAIAAFTAGASFVAALSFVGITNAFSAAFNYFSKKPAASTSAPVAEPVVAPSSTAAMNTQFANSPQSSASNDEDLDDEEKLDATASLLPVQVPVIELTEPAAEHTKIEEEEAENKLANSM